MKKEQSLLQAFLESRARPHFNILRIASAVIAAETAVFGAFAFEVTIGGSPTTGRTAIDCSAAASLTAAAQTLTLAANAGDTQTVVIQGQTYTFKTALTASTTANEVLIGASASASIDNLIAAINKAAGGGTTYGSETVANASVTAAAGAGDTMVVTSRTKGTVGNAYTTTETLANGSWGAATLAGGADTSASDFTTIATAAINAAGLKLVAQRISANEILVVDLNKPTNSVTCTETLSGSNNVWAAAASFGGEGEPEDVPALSIIKRSATATEVTLETMHFFFPFVPVSAIVQVRTSTGAIKAIDALITIDANRVTITSSGSTDIAATDTVTVLASA